MANKRIDELTAITGATASGDILEIQDVSSTSENANGDSKKATIAEIVSAANINAVGAILESDFAAKGDILSTADATTVTVLTVGTNGQVLTAASGQSTGMKWGSPHGDSTSFVLVGKSANAATATTYFGTCPIAGTVTAVGYSSLTTTTSDASNLWTLQVQNKDNSDASLLAAAYDTNAIGDFVQYAETSLGAVHGTGANLVLAAGDFIQAVFTETGTATALNSSDAWIRLTVTPS